ncbi:L-histidine N(alpha)-methyltransferase [Telluribacter humicola]|uniref:L-histidine N(alpha)-methyltransferase n=1 Tax=Telluribacter humicola TaxID=1720261 RepID=UPI001A956A98|nr:L-histidine N(alpha)-methyltransferase [Telluribacter humicola]
MNDILVDSPFRQDVLKGLSSNPKYLLPKYFYDAKGDQLFQQIMGCPEYYLTRAEEEILRTQSRQIIQSCAGTNPMFDVIELGAGDASKTLYLLQEALRLRCSRQYYPIDISTGMVDYLDRMLPPILKGMQISGRAGEYFPMLEHIQAESPTAKLVVFLGATIGNMLPEEALGFLEQLRGLLQEGDYLLVGFDLKKNPQVILDAYNDKEGLTRDFNLNLLHRMNRELGADFKPNQFEHFPVYDPITGSCKSYLISLLAQQVTFDDTVIAFERDEPIYMEISQKYNEAEIQELAAKAGYEPVDAFFDSCHQFVDVLWRV